MFVFLVFLVDVVEGKGNPLVLVSRCTFCLRPEIIRSLYSSFLRPAYAGVWTGAQSLELHKSSGDVALWRGFFSGLLTNQ